MSTNPKSRLSPHGQRVTWIPVPDRGGPLPPLGETVEIRCLAVLVEFGGQSYWALTVDDDYWLGHLTWRPIVADDRPPPPGGEA